MKRDVKNTIFHGLICYNTLVKAKYRGIVYRLIYRSPKPKSVVRFHVPLPYKKDLPQCRSFLYTYLVGLRFLLFLRMLAGQFGNEINYDDDQDE